MSLNVFAYCRNNPIKRYDKQGYRDEEVLALAFADGPEPGPADVIALAIYAVDNLAPVIEEDAEALYGDLQYAAEYYKQEYETLVTKIKDTGLQAHHIVEKRFAAVLNNIKSKLMDSVAVTKEEHQVFTNAWRNSFAYGKTNYQALKPDQIWNAAQQIYKNYPGLLKSVENLILGN